MNAPSYKEVEIHLHRDPYLVRKYGQAIKRLGGRYSHARSYWDKRFVHLPASPEGIALADKLLREFGYGIARTVIARGGECERYSNNHTFTVQFIKADGESPMADFAAKYERSFFGRPRVIREVVA